MLLPFFNSKKNSLELRRLLVEIYSRDGSRVTAYIRNTMLVLNTTYGLTKIPFSHTRRLDNISRLQTLRNIKRLNKFRVICVDGQMIAGNLISPGKLKIKLLNVAHSEGIIKLVDLYSLQILDGESKIDEHGLKDSRIHYRELPVSE